MASSSLHANFSISAYSFRFPPPSSLPSPTTPTELDSSFPRPPSRETHLSSRSRRDSWEKEDSHTPGLEEEGRRPSATGTFGGESTPRAGTGAGEGWVQEDEEQEIRGQGRASSSREQTPWEDHHDQHQEGARNQQQHPSSSFPLINSSRSNSLRSRPSPPSGPLLRAPSTHSQIPEPHQPQHPHDDVFGDTDDYSIASSQSGYIVPAPEPERSKERSMLDLGGDEESEESSSEELDGGEVFGDHREVGREEEEREEREWMAWKAGEKEVKEGWKRGRGSKLERVLGEGAQWASLPLSTYQDVLTGPGFSISRETVRSVSPRAEPHLKPSVNRGHVVKPSMDSAKQSYLSLEGSDDSKEEEEIASLRSAELLFSSSTSINPATSSSHPSHPSAFAPYQPNNSQWQPQTQPRSSNLLDTGRYDASDSTSFSATLSLSSLTPEEKSRLLRRARKLENRLGVTLNGDLLAGSLTPPPRIAARAGTSLGGGRRASDPERMSGSFDGGERRFEPAAAFGTAREEQTVLRPRAKSGLKRIPSFGGFGRGSAGMQKSSSQPHTGSESACYSSSDSVATVVQVQEQERPSLAHRSSLPTSPVASSFNLDRQKECQRHPNGNHQQSSFQSQTPPPTSWTPRTNIPRHHLDRLVQNSSPLSLPSNLSTRNHRPGNENEFDRSSIISTSTRRYSIDSPIDDFSVLPPTQDFTSSSSFNPVSEEDAAARRLRKIRLQKIHHLMGGEVPAEQLVDGPGTGPWLEPASTHHQPKQPHRSLSTSKLNLSGMDAQWKAKVVRVKEKASEMKPSFSKGSGGGGSGAGGGKFRVRTRSDSKNRSADEGGGETSFLSLEGRELPEVGTSKRGLKLNKLFGDTPSPNLYHHTHPSKIASSPSRSLFGSISSGNTGRQRSSSSSAGSRNSASTIGSGGSAGRENRVSASSTDALDFLK